MKYYDYDERQSKKIPYDKEPIVRQTSYNNKKANKSSGGGAPSKALVFVVGILIVLNLILSFLIMGVIRDGSGTKINNTTVNITSSGVLDIAAVTSKAKMSTVCVHAGYTNESTEEPNYQGFFKMSSKGSGVIFEDDKEAGVAYIITCHHVVKGYTTQVYVLLHDSFIPIKATFIGSSKAHDIAVLKIESDGEYQKSTSKACDIADSALCTLGEGAVAIGNPLGMGFSSTNGVVSSLTDLVSFDGIVRRVMRTSAAINGGNSGGGLYNARGELIGIVNAKGVDNPNQNNYVDNIGYAIPSNVAHNLAKNILINGRNPVKAVLGISMLVSSEGIKEDIIEGVRVPVQKVVISEVESGSAADKAGLELNDHITAFMYGDKLVNVTNIYSFEDHAFAINKGDSVTFYIERNGRSLQKVVVIEETISSES